MKKVFISRNLTDDSVFKKLLENAGFQVFGASLIKFSAIPIHEIPKVDWVFFYSKNGVKYFFQGLRKSNIKIPENLKWATIGAETAKALASEFRQPDFIGNGNGLDTAINFIKKAKNQKVLFPQAESSLKSIQQNAGNKLVAIDLVVYKNIPKTHLSIPNFDCIAFTSPLNAKVYFDNKSAEDSQKFYAIGQTTGNALIDLGIANFEVPTSPSETALAKTIIKSTKSAN